MHTYVSFSMLPKKVKDSLRKIGPRAKSSETGNCMSPTDTPNRAKKGFGASKK